MELLAVDIAKSDESGNDFAGRLQISRALSKTITIHANKLEPLVGAFIEDLLSIDQMTRLVFQLLGESGEISEAADFLDSFKTLAESAGPALASSSGLADTVRNNARWSKDLRPPSTRLERSFRQLADARSIFEGWLKQMPQIPGKGE